MIRNKATSQFDSNTPVQAIYVVFQPIISHCVISKIDSFQAN